MQRTGQLLRMSVSEQKQNLWKILLEDFAVDQESWGIFREV